MSDTTAPVLLGLTLPSSIDLAKGTASFTVGVQAQDEPGGSGIRHVTVEFKDRFWGVYGGQHGTSKVIGFDYWTGDNFSDATPTSASGVMQMSNLTQSGNYEIARVVVTDGANNQRIYDPGQLRALGLPTSIAVTGGIVDTAAPTLVSLKLPTSIDLGFGFSPALQLEGVARDNGGASVRTLTISFDKPLDFGNGPSTELRLTTLGRVEDVVHSTLVHYPGVSTKTPPGVYNITNVRVTDYLDNARDYSTTQLQGMGIGTAMTVIGKEQPAVLPRAALSWSMTGQGALLTLTPESWGAAPVDSFALTIARDPGTGRLDGVALTGGATGEFTFIERDHGVTIVGKNIAGIGPGTGIAVSMSQVPPTTDVSLGFTALTINGVQYQHTGAHFVADYYRGTAAADHIERWNLPDLVDGGGGLDTLRVHGARSDYFIYKSSDGFLLYPRLDPVTRLANVERIAFDDGHVALDTDGAPGQLYRLYQAAFDRAPDLTGIGHWLKRMEAGDSLKQIAGYFVASKEFADLTGAASADRDFVTALYDNVLHRQPDAVGLDFWTAVLGRGALNRAEVLVEFSESPENVAQLVGTIKHGIDFLP